MADKNSPINTDDNILKVNTGSNKSHSITVSVKKKQPEMTSAISEKKIIAEEQPKKLTLTEKRVALYEYQALMVNELEGAFPIEQCRSDFIELERFKTAVELDKRGITEMDKLHIGFDHLYVIDDLINDITNDVATHDTFGWVVYSSAKNHLNLPTVDVSSDLVLTKEANITSIPAYTLMHFGVTSFTSDRAFFIGNIVGYLFASYYCAHLKINYTVTAMKSKVLHDFNASIPTVVSNTQQIQSLSLVTKKKIYQLAVMCAQTSLFQVNKAIERMLIADVNDFDKKTEQEILANLLRYGG